VTLLPLIPLLDPSFSPPRPRSLLLLTMIGFFTLVLAMFAAGAQCELGQGVVRRRLITHTLCADATAEETSIFYPNVMALPATMSEVGAEGSTTTYNIVLEAQSADGTTPAVDATGIVFGCGTPYSPY
jgi:hypothetical protein